MLVPTKSIFKSRTFWVNVAGGVVVLLEYFDAINVGSETLGTALIVANLILRYLTKQPVTLTGHTAVRSVPPAGL